MKKYLLLCSALTMASSAQAADLNCTALPDCADLGYTQTEADCEGFFALKCPFDTSKLFCGGDKCKVGSILYDDFKCYEEIQNSKGKLGIVFDTEKRMAIGTSEYTGHPWGQNSTDYTISNSYSSATNGFENTKSLYDDAVASAGTANYPYLTCYRMTTGDVSAGTWFLPSVSEWQTIANNLTAINAGFAEITSPLQISTSRTMWSSNEASSTAAVGVGMSGGASTTGKTTTSFYYRCAIQY